MSCKHMFATISLSVICSHFATFSAVCHCLPQCLSLRLLPAGNRNPLEVKAGDQSVHRQLSKVGYAFGGVWRWAWAQDVPTSIEQGLGGCLGAKSAIINLDFLRNPNTYVPQRAQDLHIGSLTLIAFAFLGDLRLGLPCLTSRSPETATAGCSNSDTSQTLESLPDFRPE